MLKLNTDFNFKEIKIEIVTRHTNMILMNTQEKCNIDHLKFKI